MTRQPLIVMRARDMTKVHPRTDWSHTCDRCGEPVGVYPSGQHVIATLSREGVELVCHVCKASLPRPYKTALAPGAEEERAQSVTRQ